MRDVRAVQDAEVRAVLHLPGDDGFGRGGEGALHTQGENKKARRGGGGRGGGGVWDRGRNRRWAGAGAGSDRRRNFRGPGTAYAVIGECLYFLDGVADCGVFWHGGD